jgi:alpha-tubulin suppressor-like RCC1 family protein
MNVRWWPTLLGFAWWACTAPKPNDRLPRDDQMGGTGAAPSGGVAGVGRGGTSGEGSGGSGGSEPADGSGATAGAGGGTGGSAGSEGSAGVPDGGSGTGGDAGGGTAGAGSGGIDGSAGTGRDAGTSDAGSDATTCPSQCPLSAPVCSTGACRRITQIAPGSGYTCALLEDGTVRCWGINDLWQLGDGSQILRSKPGPPVVGVTGVKHLGAGHDHTCAVTEDGSVWCWGNNNQAQLGVARDNPGFPVRVQGFDGPVAEVECNGVRGQGSGYSCARLRSGSVWCWGSNEYGELGNGMLSAPIATPAPVLNLEDVVQVALADHGVCALKDTGSVVCWGNQSLGPLGTLPNARHLTTPEQVPDLSDVRFISAGYDHYCAIVGEAGQVKCWGDDIDGELGDGDLGYRSEGIVDTGRIGAEVRMGFRSTCIRSVVGDIFCLGYNPFGQLGQGNRNNAWKFERAVLLSSPSASFGTRYWSGCALLATGRVQCWGYNEYGGIGNGTVGGDALTPEFVIW